MFIKWAPFERPWANLISRYSVFVARNPWPFIILPCIMTIGLSSGIFLRFRLVRGVHYLYSPLNAQWKSEEAVFGENWASDDNHFYPGKDVLRRRGLYLIVEAKDKGDILRREDAAQFLQNECFSNIHAKLIADVYANGNQAKFNITYPLYRTRFATEPVDVSRTLGGVVVHNDIVQSAKAWLVLFQLRNHGRSMKKLSADFENIMAQSIESGTVPGSLLEILYFHSDTFEQELAKENKRITPMFSITFFVLILFSILCTFNMRWITVPPGILRSTKDAPLRIPVIDWVKRVLSFYPVLSKPLMGVIGVLSTVMAIISSTGLLLLLDVTFVDMCTVMPFLSLSELPSLRVAEIVSKQSGKISSVATVDIIHLKAMYYITYLAHLKAVYYIEHTIGIDDSFLILAAWHDTSRRVDVVDRIRVSMRHAAVSISITTLTDSLAFLIGAIAPLPAVKFFCLYSCAAIAFIFLYCMTIFFGCLALQGRLEANNANSVTMIPVIDLANPGGRSHSDVVPEIFEDYYTPFIVNRYTVMVAIGLYGIYVTAIVIGIQKVVVGFDLVNIVLVNSRPRRFLELRQQFFPEDITRMDLAVLRPPNMMDIDERERFLKLLEKIESTSCSIGRNSTEFWYFSFQNYMKTLGFGDSWDDITNDKESFSANSRLFFMANEKFSYDVLRESNGSIKAFRLATRLRNISSDELIYQCAKQMRSICRDHPQYNLTTYTQLWNLADQYEIMWPQTIQDLYISIVVMLLVAVLFIPQPLCAPLIGVSIASVALGVLGIMPFFGVNLDATSMITIAMSVGFSVDFAAHVSYSFITQDVNDDDKDVIFKRLRNTMGSVGWPITQAAISVLLGISSLSFVNSYVVQTCFKTVILTIIFGTVHALLFLPLVLTFTQKLYVECIDRKDQRKSSINTHL
ncbi:patched family protein [Dictyocaulus viviparus]|uniref:Patched family protein n=1 Tax=Dictyocaulus viviparus TaxID=29172 RepID=A0A0D8Y4Z8_DICVI|nr:patched family protein [Dictyocaulus viviparus]